MSKSWPNPKLLNKGFHLWKRYPVVRDHPASHFFLFMLKRLGEFLSCWTDIDILPKAYRHSCWCISLDIAFTSNVLKYGHLLRESQILPRSLGFFISLCYTSYHDIFMFISTAICDLSIRHESYPHYFLFSDAEWIAHSEQLCHSSQHPSLPPSHPSVTLHGVQRHHVGLCDRPHMAAAQWQCSLSPQLWHHRPTGLQEHGCHARLGPSRHCLRSVTLEGVCGGQRDNSKERSRERSCNTQ